MLNLLSLLQKCHDDASSARSRLRESFELKCRHLLGCTNLGPSPAGWKDPNSGVGSDCGPLVQLRLGREIMPGWNKRI